MQLKASHILVTRPAPQSQVLMQAIEAQGGHAIHFPVIALEDLSTNNRALLRLKDELNQYDMLLFISANAVDYSLPQLVNPPLPCQLKLAVVGKSTANALQTYGYRADICPVEFNSEALLNLAELSEDAIKQHRIGLIKGEGGRDLLSQTLRQRGAIVDEIVVYRRCLPAQSAQLNQTIDCIVISSAEGLENLLRLLPQAAWLKHTPMVLISQRIQAKARQLGITAPLYVAEQASDAGLLNALLQWKKDSKWQPDKSS